MPKGNISLPIKLPSPEHQIYQEQSSGNCALNLASASSRLFCKINPAIKIAVAAANATGPIVKQAAAVRRSMGRVASLLRQVAKSAIKSLRMELLAGPPPVPSMTIWASWML